MSLVLFRKSSRSENVILYLNSQSLVLCTYIKNEKMVIEEKEKKREEERKNYRDRKENYAKKG